MKSFFSRFFYLMLMLVSAGSAWAQGGYASRALQIMVPYPPGGASDVTARAMNTLIGKDLGGSAIVENLGGASGALAANKVLNSPADGYYLFQGSPNELILSGLANTGVKYKPEDFEFVGAVAISPIILAVNAKLPINNIDEFVAYAKNSKSGLNFGSVGAGSLIHLLGELLSKKIDAPMMHIPYKGGTPLLTDLVGGQVDFSFMPYQASLGEFTAAGKMKIIAKLSPQSLPAPMQNVPLISKRPELRDFNYDIWTAFFVKSGTPANIVQKLNTAVVNSLKDNGVKDVLLAQGKTIFDPMGVAEGKKFYADEVSRYRELVRTVGYKAK